MVPPAGLRDAPRCPDGRINLARAARAIAAAAATIAPIIPPSIPLVIRRKERVAGIWVNTASVTVDAAPSFYAVATTCEKSLPKFLKLRIHRQNHYLSIHDYFSRLRVAKC